MIKKIMTLTVVSLLITLATEAQAATLAMEMKKVNYQVGELAAVNIYVVSLDRAINAVSAKITYPKELLELVEAPVSAMDKGLWLAQNDQAQAGQFAVNWLALNGYQGKGIKMVSLHFKTKAKGRAVIGVKDLQVLANDGLGSSVKSVASGALIGIGSVAKAGSVK